MKPSCVVMLALAGLTWSSCGRSHQAREKFNVVLVSLDTLRADHLSAFGYGRETSPNIQAFAEQSLVFEQAFSHSPKTAPSHMSIMTGLLPNAHGVRNYGEDDNFKLGRDVPTLPKILKQHGWRTAAFTSGGHVRPMLGFGDGFEVYETTGMVHTIFDRGLEQAAQFAGEPFFLFLHTYEIHDPYIPPKSYREKFVSADYAGNIIGDRKELKQLTEAVWSKLASEFWEHVDRASAADIQHLKDLYDGSIRYCDDSFGDLLDGLDRIDALDNTLVILLSDHGESFGERGEFIHESVHQELLHVPLILGLPKSFPKRLRGRFDERVQLVDVLPTVMEVLDLPLPAIAQGRSLLGVARGDGSGPRPHFSSWPRRDLHAVREGDWKLIAHLPAGEAETLELFDLRVDPGELHDVALDEPGVTARLRALLEEHRKTSSAILGLQGRGSHVELTEELKAELQALGYLDGKATTPVQESVEAGANK
jgi:arylsulfatase A-like enzyme